MGDIMIQWHTYKYTLEYDKSKQLFDNECHNKDSI